MNSKNTPSLRFPGFTEDWEEKKMFEITNNEDNKRKPVSKTERKKGIYPYYGANGIQDYIDGYLFDGNYLLVGEDGSVLSENNTPVINWVSGKFWVNNHAHVLSQKGNYSLKYVSYILSTIKIPGLVTGIPPKLNQDNLNNILLALPRKPAEQHKIASCLSEMDNLIVGQDKKVDALKEKKKGLMQQIFPQQGETTPRLRFPGFEGEWMEKKMSDVFTRLREKNAENNKNVLTISAQFGLISQLEFFKKSVSASDVTGYYLLHKGDFAYNKSSSQGKPVGAIKPLKLYEKGVVSTLYICFRCKDPNAIEFWEHYFDAGILDKEIMTIAQEGARNHGLLNVPTNDFFELNVIMPKPAEQNKIAECLTSLDELIAAESAKLDSLKDHKKGLMQQLFPQPSK